MKDIHEILGRLEELKARLAMVEAERETELKKPFKDTDYKLLRFLHKERDVYLFSLQQLEWVLAG